MSHFEEVKTEYTDPELVVEAIKEAFPFIETVEVASDFEYDGSTVVCRGYHGDTATHFGKNPIKIVARTPNKYDLGFALAPDGTYQLVADWGGYGYGFLANSEVKDAIASDRLTTEQALAAFAQFLESNHTSYDTAFFLTPTKRKEGAHN